MRIVAIAALVACLATPAPAADDSLLARLVGDWIGRGLFRQNADAKPERVYCKITNAFTEDGAALKQTGRCALTSRTGAMEITITALGSGRYTGSGHGLGLAARGQATFSGTGTANRLALVAELVDTQTQKKRSETATIDLSAGGYRLRAQMTDPTTGATYTASEIRFAAE